MTVERDERDDVEHTQARVDAVMSPEVDQFDRAPGDGPHGRLHAATGHGEHRPVMVRIAVHVEDEVGSGIDDGPDDGGVTPLAHIDDTLEHGAAGRLPGPTG